MRRLLAASSLLLASMAAAAPPAEEVVTWSQLAVSQSGGGGFAFSDTSWNAAGSLPIASAVVLYEQLYGPIWGTALLANLQGIPNTCPYDEGKLSNIRDSFYDYLASGEIKALLTDEAAVAAHLQMIDDAVTQQDKFISTPAFSVTVTGGYLVTTGVQVASSVSQSGGGIINEPLNWDEATELAAEQIAAAGLDKQFNPLTALDGDKFTRNVNELKTRLQGHPQLQIDPIMAVWGLNGSRIFTRVANETKYMVVDAALGVAYGPYEDNTTGETFVGDAVAPYVGTSQQPTAVLAVLTPCKGNPNLNPGTVPKPATWPAMPAWPAAPAWTCERSAPGDPESACRCQVKRSVADCDCTFFGLFCDDCVEYIECIFDPGIDPGMPATCGGPGLANPPAPGTFCDEYWGYE